MTAAAEIRTLVRAAGEDEAVAAKHAAAGEYRQAASRMYYAAFYYINAVLRTRELAFKSHGAAIAAFNKEFIHVGLFPPEDYAALKNAFELRHEADYRLITHGAAVINEALAAVNALGVRARRYLASYL